MIEIFKKSLNVAHKFPLQGVRGRLHFQHANLMYFEQENN